MWLVLMKSQKNRNNIVFCAFFHHDMFKFLLKLKFGFITLDNSVFPGGLGFFKFCFVLFFKLLKLLVLTLTTLF